VLVFAPVWDGLSVADSVPERRQEATFNVLAVALAASVIPARRAMRVSPTEALRGG